MQVQQSQSCWLLTLLLESLDILYTCLDLLFCCLYHPFGHFDSRLNCLPRLFTWLCRWSVRLGSLFVCRWIDCIFGCLRIHSGCLVILTFCLSNNTFHPVVYPTSKVHPLKFRNSYYFLVQLLMKWFHPLRHEKIPSCFVKLPFLWINAKYKTREMCFVN